MTPPPDLSKCKLIDLTHTLRPDIPTWNGPGRCGFQHDIKLDYDDGNRDPGFRVQQIRMHAGVGTHMDAPSHCVPGGKSIADIELAHLIAPCVRIDVSGQAHEKYSLSVEELTEFEAQYGQVPPGAFFLIYTGWEKFWNDPAKYHNNYIFPSVSAAAAEFLLKRQIVGIGIDTFSPDRPEDGFPVHEIILGAGKYIIENVANGNQLPVVGAYIFALPIKTQDGTEAPIRFIGIC